MLTFRENGHEYKSLPGGKDIKWTSVTSLISKYKPPFDSKKQSKKSSKNENSKWFGMEPSLIEEIWEKERNRSTTLGTWYHNKRENELYEAESLVRGGLTLPVMKTISQGDLKMDPPQKLVPGIYPEHLVYLASAGICGQVDYTDVMNGVLNIADYKTNKEIKTSGYMNPFTGETKKMLGVLSHLDDCNLVHYQLQMSLYLYMMLRHNPKLKPGLLRIIHVTFKKEKDDKYGMPVTLYNELGEPVVEKSVNYDVPYLEEEAKAIINEHKILQAL